MILLAVSIVLFGTFQGVFGQIAPNQEEIIREILDTTQQPKLISADQFGGKGYIYRSEPWGDNDSIYGYKFRSPLKTREILRYEDTIIYDKVYHIDGPLTRRVPQTQLEAPENTVTIMGCSFMFGVGLNDDETIMANLTRELPNTQVDNITLIGSGPNNTLAYLEETHTFRPGQEEIYIYTFSEDEHVTRANGFMVPLEWLATSPYYKEEQVNGKRRMVRTGTIEEHWPVRSKVLTWLRNYLFIPLQINRDFPPIRDSHREYTCNLIEQMDREIKSKNPKAQFYVYYYPFSPPPNDYYHQCFSERGINELSFQKIKAQGLRYPHDGHPNEQGSQIIARDIVRALREFKK